MPVLVPSDEWSAAKLLFELRFPTGWRCAHCGHSRSTHLKCRPRLFECNACGRAVSVTAGTALHRCRVPLVKVVAAALLLSRERSISARRLAGRIGVSIETAWTLGHRLRSGFLRQDLRLEGEPVLSSCTFRLRPPPRTRRLPDQVRARFQILWDRTLRIVVQTGGIEPHALRRFVDRHSGIRRPLIHPMRFGYDPSDVGNRVHHGVSDRWLPFYACALAGWHNARIDRADGARQTLERALDTPTHPFASLRPHRPPRRYLQDWDQGDRPFQVLTGWGLYEPRGEVRPALVPDSAPPA